MARFNATPDMTAPAATCGWGKAAKTPALPAERHPRQYFACSGIMWWLDTPHEPQTDSALCLVHNTSLAVALAEGLARVLWPLLSWTTSRAHKYCSRCCHGRHPRRPAGGDPGGRAGESCHLGCCHPGLLSSITVPLSELDCRGCSEGLKGNIPPAAHGSGPENTMAPAGWVQGGSRLGSRKTLLKQLSCTATSCCARRWQENTPHYQGPHSLLAATQMMLTYDPDEAGEDLRVTRTSCDAPSATMCNLSDKACVAVVTKGLDARKDCDT